MDIGNVRPVDPATLLYVGVSRAQVHLVVLGDEGTVGRMRRGR